MLACGDPRHPCVDNWKPYPSLHEVAELGVILVKNGKGSVVAL